jgi:hypothetical protein
MGCGDAEIKREYGEMDQGSMGVVLIWSLLSFLEDDTWLICNVRSGSWVLNFESKLFTYVLENISHAIQKLEDGRLRRRRRALQRLVVRNLVIYVRKTR